LKITKKEANILRNNATKEDRKIETKTENRRTKDRRTERKKGKNEITKKTNTATHKER
jgi:hypothetical protein